MAHDPGDIRGEESRVLFSPVAEAIFASNFLLSKDPTLAGLNDEWKVEQRSRLPESLRPFIEFAAEGFDWATLSLIDYLPITSCYDDWNAFSARVAEEAIEDFLFVVMNGDIPREEIDRLLREPSKASGFVDRLSCYSRMKPEAAIQVFSEPEAFRSQLLAYVAGNRTPLFEEKLLELQPRYESRMRSVRGRLKGGDPIVLAEEISKKPYRAPRGLRSYAFLPSYFLGRKNLYSIGAGNFALFFNINSLDDMSAEESKEISERLKVLGDRTRLDILRLLSEGPSYGKEIAQRLGLTTATVSRQLDQLKEAGLVLEDRADANNVKFLRLERSAVDALFRRVQGFIGTTDS